MSILSPAPAPALTSALMSLSATSSVTEMASAAARESEVKSEVTAEGAVESAMVSAVKYAVLGRVHAKGRGGAEIDGGSGVIWHTVSSGSQSPKGKLSIVSSPSVSGRAVREMRSEGVKSVVMSRL